MSAAKSTFLLALDLSLNRPGYAVLEVGARSLKIATCGHIDVDRKLEHGGRLRQMREEIARIVDAYPRLERIFVKEEAPQTFSGHILQKAHGVAEELLADFSYVDYGPTTIKLIIGGSGKAEKGDVERGVREILGLGDEFVFTTDDASDACAAGLTHLALTDRLPPGKRYDALRERVAQWRSKRRGSKKAKGSA